MQLLVKKKCDKKIEDILENDILAVVQDLAKARDAEHNQRNLMKDYGNRGSKSVNRTAAREKTVKFIGSDQ